MCSLFPDTIINWDASCPTDGSQYSIASTNKAINLAKVYGSKMKIISIVDVTDEFQAQAPDAVDALVDQAKELVDGIGRKAADMGVPAQTALSGKENHISH
jgi:nucleotide-binding universal stress UspA family protein